MIHEEDHELYAAPKALQENAHIQSMDEYKKLYEQSLDDPDTFWSAVAEDYFWHKRWSGPVQSHNFDMRKGPISIEWFAGAETNACYNAVDRHVEAGHGDRVAFFWEGNDPGVSSSWTYARLLSEVCRIANYLTSQGVGRGDDVAVYLPMVPQLPAVMLACARIGAVHSVVFAGFSAEALAGRMLDSAPKVVFTTTGVKRGAKAIALKPIVDEAVEICCRAASSADSGDAPRAENGDAPRAENGDATRRFPARPRVVVLDHAPSGLDAGAVAFDPETDVWWHEAVDEQSDVSPVAWLPAEHPCFKLYTSGSTGKPKGVLHSTAGYMVGTGTTFKYVFDHRPGDVYWCTADCGWITGHSYVAYGPLFHGATQVLFEGVPTWPDAGRCWDVVDKYGVSLFYTAPTAIRSLMAAGDDPVTARSRASLRVLGSVGEPINPPAWRWYRDVVGGGRCAVVDTWWQTETGQHMITPLPGATPAKPGSATLPFFGVEPALLDEQGCEIQGEGQGYLVLKRSWPAAARTLAGDHARFEQTYFSAHKGYYFSGDGARRDADGYYWILGRVDDVINVSGHRIGTAEVESALVGHAFCCEAAVVPVDHAIKGQAIYAFVTLQQGHAYPPPPEVRARLLAEVRRVIGPIATPEVLHWAPALPKTRSGKIMRRILRKIAAREEHEIGDVSTLADPGVVDLLVQYRGV